jgi:hypothetical protein
MTFVTPDEAVARATAYAEYLLTLDESGGASQRYMQQARADWKDYDRMMRVMCEAQKVHGTDPAFMASGTWAETLEAVTRGYETIHIPRTQRDYTDYWEGLPCAYVVQRNKRIREGEEVE